MIDTSLSTHFHQKHIDRLNQTALINDDAELVLTRSSIWQSERSNQRRCTINSHQVFYLTNQRALIKDDAELVLTRSSIWPIRALFIVECCSNNAASSRLRLCSTNKMTQLQNIAIRKQSGSPSTMHCNKTLCYISICKLTHSWHFPMSGVDKKYPFSWLH